MWSTVYTRNRTLSMSEEACVSGSFHVTTPRKKSPFGDFTWAGEGKIRPSRIFARCAAPAASLTAVFRVSASIVHPHPNPLHVSGSLRLGFFPRDPLHVKSPLAGTLRGAGEGNRTLDASLGSSNFAIKLHPQG